MSGERNISFFVPGRPQQKGSTKSFRHAKTGKIVTMSANKNLKLWEATVRLAASEAEGWGGITEKAVAVHVAFLFLRPKCDYGTGQNSRTLKGSAPREHIKTPDLDKLARGILDGLSGVLFRDDRQVVQLWAIKQYATAGESGAMISVKEIGSAEASDPPDGATSPRCGESGI